VELFQKHQLQSIFASNVHHEDDMKLFDIQYAFCIISLLFILGIGVSFLELCIKKLKVLLFLKSNSIFQSVIFELFSHQNNNTL